MIPPAKVDSATKLMLGSYGALDETGQNQMWLARDLMKGIINMQKTQDNGSGKLAKLVKELLTHAEKAKIEPLR